MLTTFVVVLTVLVVMDLMAGGVHAARLLGHGLVVLGLILMIVLERLPNPAGGSVPGMPTVRRRWNRRGVADAAIGTDAEDLPPDLRPSAQRGETAAAYRQIA
jgi:predicted anti-sigma-YlaC factor YlaD